MKKIFGQAYRVIDKLSYQQRAIRKVQKIDKGEKVLPQKYESDKRSFEEAQENEEIRQLLTRKDKGLIERLNKFLIRSKDPPELPQSKRELPKRPEEYATHETLESEYGFVEPPSEKLEKNRITFREVLEIIRARMEYEQQKQAKTTQQQEEQIVGASTSGFNADPTSSGDTATGQFDDRTMAVPPEELLFVDDGCGVEFLSDHPAVKRVDSEKLELIWHYFRPFSRRHKQQIVHIDEWEFLVQYIEDGVPGMIERERDELIQGLVTERRWKVDEEPAKPLPLMTDEKYRQEQQQRLLVDADRKRFLTRKLPGRVWQTVAEMEEAELSAENVDNQQQSGSDRSSNYQDKVDRRRMTQANRFHQLLERLHGEIEEEGADKDRNRGTGGWPKTQRNNLEMKENSEQKGSQGDETGAEAGPSSLSDAASDSSSSLQSSARSSR